jgi:hypothetical protein
LILWVARRRLVQPLFDRPLEPTARQQHAPLAAQALNADIRPNPIDAPLIAAARMRLAHLHHIAHLNIARHSNFSKTSRKMRLKSQHHVSCAARLMRMNEKFNGI